MAPDNEPNLLYTIGGVEAYHMVNGNSQSLTPGGPQTLSLWKVPTTDAHGSPGPEADFYLSLHLPPDLDLPLPATTHVYHQPPTSYLIPRSDRGPDSGAFARIEFPATGSQEDVDMFEAILAQCTAFVGRVPPPSTAEDDGPPPYDPAEGYQYAGQGDSATTGGLLVLMDPEDGRVLGELGDGFQVVEDGTLSTEAVDITLPSEDSREIKVAPASEESSEMAASLHPAYQKSKLVSSAAAASRLMVTCSEKVSEMVQGRADSFTQNGLHASKPVTFKPVTSARIHRMHELTGDAQGLSHKAVDKLGDLSQNLGAKLARRKDADGIGADGKPLDGYKPGLLRKSLMAWSTVAGGVEYVSHNLFMTTANAAATVAAHKWGPEAGEMVDGAKNVALVYMDVTGVSHWTILNGVAAGMVVGKTTQGQNIVVGGDGGGESSSGKAEGSADAASSHATVAEGKKPMN